MTRALHAKPARLAFFVASAAMFLTGCGMHPGAAIVAGDEQISDQEVDDAAAALCASTVSSAEAQGQPRPELAARGARQAAVQLLLDSELSRQFGEAQGIQPDQQEVSAALAQNAQGIEAIPAAQREDFRALFRGFQEGQLILVEVDPRYGEYADGTVTPVSGSLSIPVSERAAQGANAEPPTEWTAGLPASQKC